MGLVEDDTEGIKELATAATEKIHFCQKFPPDPAS